MPRRLTSSARRSSVVQRDGFASDLLRVVRLMPRTQSGKRDGRAMRRSGGTGSGYSVNHYRQSIKGDVDALCHRYRGRESLRPDVGHYQPGFDGEVIQTLYIPPPQATMLLPA
jgi:hypothetical protein